jgi:hypothetical protein
MKTLWVVQFIAAALFGSADALAQSAASDGWRPVVSPPAKSAKSPVKSPVTSEDVNLVDVDTLGFQYPSPIELRAERKPASEESESEPVPSESPDPSRLKPEFLKAESERLHFPLVLLTLGEKMRFQTAQDEWKYYDNWKRRAARKTQNRAIASTPAEESLEDLPWSPPSRTQANRKK